MNKENRENWHYVILSLALTLVVFIAHWLSDISGIESLVSYGIGGWVILFLWYFLFLIFSLILLDNWLHEVLRI